MTRAHTLHSVAWRATRSGLTKTCVDVRKARRRKAANHPSRKTADGPALESWA
jgi:hypothetical protein